MRRNGHPSRPKATTCCFFASLKTLLIPTKANALRRNQRPQASFSLAGFEVTLIGRFWVTAEAFFWKDMNWIRDHWKGPIVIKGVLTAEDARRSLDHGAAAIVVSNH